MAPKAECNSKLEPGTTCMTGVVLDSVMEESVCGMGRKMKPHEAKAARLPFIFQDVGCLSTAIIHRDKKKRRKFIE